MAGAAATTCGCFERRAISGGQSLMPSSAMRCRLMCEVEPRRRCCRSWRNPLLMARATTSEATPAATPSNGDAGDDPDERLAALGAKVAGRDEEFEAHGAVSNEL